MAFLDSDLEHGFPKDFDSPESGPDTPIKSKSEIYDPAWDYDTDLVYNHGSNQQLEETQAAKEFFAKIDNIDTLQDETTRHWFGCLPDKFPDGAIPLFTDGEIDYQLHFSFSMMAGIDTSTFLTPLGPRLDPIEFFVHCIALASETSELELVLDPLFVIPLGKLVLNKYGRSYWTGYEIFVSGSLQVWIIYAPSEPGPFSYYNVDSGLFPPSPEKSTDTGNKLVEQIPTQNVARVWHSLKGLRTATPHDIKNEVSKSVVRARSVYLLQLAMDEVPYAMKKFEETPSIPRTKAIPAPAYMSVGTFCIPVTSPVASQLLQLALENPDQPIAKIVFRPQSQLIEDQSSLLLQAVEHDQEAVIKMINKSANIDAYASGIDFSDTKLIAVIEKLSGKGADKILKFIRDGINFNRNDKSGTAL
ncbi:hypothetical protein GGR51DRAFT_554660 [Nemania sp. FL0031]|nr:hypothetical protein GGR51DRAFT_554660 [Nemania sp. FL0031]